MKRNYTSKSGLLNPLARLPLCLVAAVLGFSRGDPAPASAYPPPGRTERVSLAFDGGEVGGQFPAGTYGSVISADGRYVAFVSSHGTFVPNDNNNTLDVFVRDRLQDTTERVSVAGDGADVFGESFDPSLNGDGRYVAFASNAQGLVPEDVDFNQDVFVRDRVAGTIERVSVGVGGVEASGSSFKPAISADGRFVAFTSTASNLVASETNGSQDVFVYERATKTIERVSVATGGGQAGSGSSAGAAITPDGRYVAFESTASNLVPNDTNNSSDVFLRDRIAGTTERVSLAPGGIQPNDRSLQASVSGDGRYVAFTSAASNLVPSDTNLTTDAFVRDRVAQTTERVSLTAAGAEYSGPSFTPAVSGDGRYVAFNVAVCSFVPGDACAFVPVGDENATVEVLVRDRFSSSTEVISIAADGGEANSFSYSPMMTPDARQIAFYSFATNLIANDTNGAADVFVRERGPFTGIFEHHAIASDCQLTSSGSATFSGTVFSSNTDPANDGAAGAAQAGAEITGASLIYRRELGDLLFRLNLLNFSAAAPGVLYGLRFTLAGDQYEVRASREGATPVFALYRCAGLSCTQVAMLSGGLGTSGSEILVSVPLQTLGIAEGASLTALQGFTAAGDTAAGTVSGFDQISLPSAQIPLAAVLLGLASAAAPESQVHFNTVASLTNANFTAELETSGLPGGDYRVWAKPCLGATCGTATSRAVHLNSGCDFAVEFIRAASRKRHGGADVFSIELPLDGSGIECRSSGENQAHEIIFTFAAAVSFAGASVTPTTGKTAELDGPPGASANNQEVSLKLKNVSDAQAVRVSLLGVSDGTNTDDVVVQLLVLAGDTNEDTRVNVGDTNQTKSRSGSLTSEDNFRSDLNLDGRINVGDTNFVKSRSGTDSLRDQEGK